MTTIADIINAVIIELSQVPGLATQTYATPRIRQNVQDAITLELDEVWYVPYMDYFTGTVNGVDGRLTADLVGPISAVTDYANIARVWPQGSNVPLKELPKHINPFTITGSSTLFISPDNMIPNRPIRIWPNTSTDTIVLWCSQSPRMPITDNDTTLIDPLLLIYDAAWMYVTDDGTVPAQVDKFMKLAQKRRDQVHQMMNNQPIPLDSRNYSGQTDQWWEVM